MMSYFLSFQSAFHRGNGCYEGANNAFMKTFSFQSAFHRGNGCYTALKMLRAYKTLDFQSAFHRGNGCYKRL